MSKAKMGKEERKILKDFEAGEFNTHNSVRFYTPIR
jgi:hypothetical protein